MKVLCTNIFKYIHTKYIPHVFIPRLIFTNVLKIWNVFFLDVNDLESKPDDRFRERVFAIKRWLKDQYVLYRDYCTMAQAINAHYVPTTLDDAKKVGAFFFDVTCHLSCWNITESCVMQ